MSKERDDVWLDDMRESFNKLKDMEEKLEVYQHLKVEDPKLCVEWVKQNILKEQI